MKESPRQWRGAVKPLDIIPQSVKREMKNTGILRSIPGWFHLVRSLSNADSAFSVFEAAHAAAETALYVLPHPLDHSRIVVAVCKIMIQRREAVFLADRLHVGQLIAIERELIDGCPNRKRRIHRKARRDRSVCSNYYVLPGTAVPFCKTQFSIRSLDTKLGFRNGCFERQDKGRLDRRATTIGRSLPLRLVLGECADKR